jgi:hypothetical protein
MTWATSATCQGEYVRRQRTHDMKAFVRVAGSSVAVALGLVLAGCSASTPGGGSNGVHPGSNGGGGSGAVKFNVQVNFTGTDNVQGSFVDNGTGSGDSSCAAYASTATQLGWLSPSPQPEANVQIGGKSITFLFSVLQSSFHGPATYSGNVLGAVAIGSNDYTGTNATVTITGDGSGNGSFMNRTALGAPSALESGTVTWTCSS